jgi:hypothetical protein
LSELHLVDVAVARTSLALAEHDVNLAHKPARAHTTVQLLLRRVLLGRP